MDVRDRIAGVRAAVDALNAAEDELVQFDIDVKYEEMVAARELIFTKIVAAQENVAEELKKEKAGARPPNPVEPHARFSLPDGTRMTFTQTPTATVTPRPVTVAYKCPAGCSEKIGRHLLARCANFARFDGNLCARIVSSSKRCYRCLLEGHVASNCPNWTTRCGHIEHHCLPHSADLAIILGK